MKRARAWLYDILLALCILAFLGSGGILACKLMAQKRNDGRLEELAVLAEEFAGAGHTDTDNGDAGSQAGPVPLAAASQEPGQEGRLSPQEPFYNHREARVKAYSQIREQNPDLVGWIKIEGTKIDYPVLQTPEDPDFYLKHDFDRKSSIYGAPYVDEECDLAQECRNVLIYGHHMKNGSMFAALDGYLEREFCEEHPTIQFDTLTEYGDYQVMAVFSINASDPEDPLYNWIYCSDEETFHNYVDYVKRRSVYDTGVEARWGDRLISLITCEYTHKDGRLIIAAKRINE